MHLLIATTNAGKIREFRQMLGDGQFEYTDLSEHREIEPPEETGDTFMANACLKAIYYAKLLNTAAIADDSGLEVDALQGKPGVHSARWAEMNNAGSGDAANNALLLWQLADVPTERRTARFVCALALADAQGSVRLTARNTVEGELLLDPRGSNGFGYDPLFYVPSLNRGMAELSMEQKQQISHRGKALRDLRQLIDRAGGIGRVLSK
jgi:XTP/dITP diphosphohydrolase